MTWLAQILRPIIEALATVLKEYVEKKERERNIKDSGKKEAVLEYYKEVVKKQKEMADIANTNSNGDVRRKLRDGSF